MSRVAVTSLVRNTGVYEPSGFLRLVDLDRRRVLFAAAVPESRQRARDPNPRGGLRGAKGIDVHSGRLVLANAERLFVVDARWDLVGEHTHPWLGGIHDILCDADGVLVTCADADLLVRVGWDGRLADHWSWRDDSTLVRALGFRAVPPFDPDVDYRDPLMHHLSTHDLVHLNAVGRTRLGLVVSFGLVLAPAVAAIRRTRAAVARAVGKIGLGQVAVAAVRRLRAARLDAGRAPGVPRVRGGTSALVRLNGSSGDVLHRAPAAAGVPNHNVLEHGGLLLYNDSNVGELVAYDPDAAAIARRIPLPGASTFARGLAALREGVVLAGTQQPAAIHAVDIEEERVLWSIELDGRPREAVYAIAVLPDEFDDPPARLSHWDAA